MSGVPSTFAVTFGPNGPEALTFEEILAGWQAVYQQIYGTNTYIESDSPDGQLLAALAQAVYDHNQADIAVYNSYSPAYAQGVALSANVQINGLQRDVPTNSTAPMVLVGQAGVQIPSGIVRDQFGNNWDLPPNLVFPDSGELDTTATCEMPGAIAADPNTIGVNADGSPNIVTIIPGWQSATNPEAATPGAPVETDAALRRRQAVSTSMPAQTPRMAIAAAISNISGVQRSVVYENKGDAPDANGIPGHSIAAVVAGGDAVAICSAIASKKSEGTGTLGSQAVTILDQMGVPDVIAYFPLSIQEIYISLTIEPLAGYVGTTAGVIQAALAYFINNLDIGETVYFNRLWNPANLSGDAATASSGYTQQQLEALSASYVVRSMVMAAAPSPNTSADVAIPFNAAAQCSSVNVIITTTT